MKLKRGEIVSRDYEAFGIYTEQIQKANAIDKELRDKISQIESIFRRATSSSGWTNSFDVERVISLATQIEDENKALKDAIHKANHYAVDAQEREVNR